MVRFFRLALTSYKGLFGWMSLKTYFITKIINPTFQLIFYILLVSYASKTKDIKSLVIGNSILLCYRSAMFGVAGCLLLERSYGTLKLNMIAPLKRITIFLAQGFMHIVDGLINIAVGLILGGLIFHVNFAHFNFLLFILTLSVTVFAIIGLGLFLGCFGLVVPDMNLIMNFFSMSIIVLSGANFPISNFPWIIQKICYLIPLTRGIEASRALIHGATFSDINGLLGGEFLLGTVYILAGIIMLQIMENLARKKATIEIF